MALITGSERHIMRAVYSLVGAKSSGLITVDEIWTRLPYKRYVKWLHRTANAPDAVTGKVFVKDKPVSKSKIKEILYSLSYAEYFELTAAAGKTILEPTPSSAKRRRKIKGVVDSEETLAPEPVAERGDREVFVVSLKDRGKNFPREEKDRVKGLVLKVVSTVAFAVLSLVVTMILRAIFAG